jgi:hypothetical protein
MRQHGDSAIRQMRILQPAHLECNKRQKMLQLVKSQVVITSLAILHILLNRSQFLLQDKVL